jgi:hypothetical protein
MNQRTDFTVVLVANGLDKQENNDLIGFCDLLNCQYKQLKTSDVLAHGVALNQLIEHHQMKWFCFCDSDIISTNALANDIPLEKNLKALSSCNAMFWDNEPVKGVLGRCNRWPDGSQNLSSFFCVYHTKTTKSIMKKYAIGFENIAVNAIQSDAIQAMLKQKGITRTNRKLDTGKAITVALEIENHQYKHIEIPSLLHIGGLSSWMLNGNKKLVHAEYHLSDQDLYNIADKNSWLYNEKALNDFDNKIFYLRRQQRLSAARYCFQLISFYVDKTPKPSHKLSDTDFVLKINKIESTIKQYFKEFS